MTRKVSSANPKAPSSSRAAAASLWIEVDESAAVDHFDAVRELGLRLLELVLQRLGLLQQGGGPVVLHVRIVGFHAGLASFSPQGGYWTMTSLKSTASTLAG